MSRILLFPFKGDRNYVHGTSLFNEFSREAQQHGVDSGLVSISFRRMIYNPLCVLEVRPSSAEDAAVAHISGRAGESLVLCINEASERGGIVRQDFDEDYIACGAILGEKSIMLPRSSHSDRVEVLVALCKKMHQQCFSGAKKWVFSRYEGVFPLPALGRIELKITRQLGSRLTCSAVFFDEGKVGDIYFS